MVQNQNHANNTFLIFSAHSWTYYGYTLSIKPYFVKFVHSGLLFQFTQHYVSEMWTLGIAKAQGGICDRALGYLAHTHLHSWYKDSLNHPPNESHLSRKPGSGRKG